MQKDLKNTLKNELGKREIEVELWDNQKMRVFDKDRLIIIALMEDFNQRDQINNEVMDKIRQLQIEEQPALHYGDYSMRKILWDVYILYVLSDEEKYVDKEQIFMLQRDKKYSKKYLFQESNIQELSEKICKLLHPERYIDSVLKEIKFEYTDENTYKAICDLEGRGNEFITEFPINSCQDILNFLNHVNADEYGVNVDEDC